MAKRVLVVGAGAAGMMAAVSAACAGASVDLYEKNEKCGKKIYITGKGRGNLTNNCDRDAFLDQVCTNRRFLYSALKEWDCQDTIRFFEENGTRTKTERGGRVFPVSDHASDVTAALVRSMTKHGVRIHLQTRVKGLLFDSLHPNRCAGICLDNGSRIEADAVIIATGGLAYPSTGSDGDGYRFAGSAGLTLVPCRPSLVPMETEGEEASLMQGLSLRNVTLKIQKGKKTLFEEQGEMLFTHFGVSGPLILSASAVAGNALLQGPLCLQIDLKSALTLEQLNDRFLREFALTPNRKISNVAGKIYPAKMIPVILRRCGIDPDLPVRDLKKESRRLLAQTTKCFSMTAVRLRGYNEAVVTSGGVSVKEIRPDTMEAKKMQGLYFAGEVLDLDARTGGYNLQIAWSTGHAAGMAAGMRAGQ